MKFNSADWPISACTSKSVRFLSASKSAKNKFSHSPFSICCILSQYTFSSGEIFMAPETLTFDLTTTFLTLGLDITSAFDSFPDSLLDFATAESLSAAKKPLDDDDEEDEDEDEDDEYEDDEEEGDEDEDEDGEYEDDEDDDDEEEEEDDDEYEDDDEEEDEDDDVDELQVGRRR